MKMIYMDHQSAAPVDPGAVEFAKRYLTEAFGNPSSLHSPGVGAREAVEEARARVAELINAESENTIIFTSGATESNNLAIRGAALRNVKKGREVAASAIEHMSVLNPMKDLQKSGFTFRTIPVDSTGLVDPAGLDEFVTDGTVVTSVMYANSEIGTVEPIGEISKAVHGRGHYLHVDAAGAAGLLPIDVQADGIDLLTLSSNAIYGPQGAGALYVKPGVKLQTVMPGGGQERGLRSGTENVFAIAGMGEAARIAASMIDSEPARLKVIRDALIKGILEIEESYLTGHPERRLPNHASFRFTGIEGEGILLLMDRAGIQVSTGSACSSRNLEASGTLLAIGLKHEEAHGSMVLTLGRSNSPDDVAAVVKAAGETMDRLRQMSPIWKSRG